MTAKEQGLPELPEAVSAPNSTAPYYTADQMRAYALAALASDTGERGVVANVCDGCPHLATEYWRDYLDNDETDSGTKATCNSAKRCIDVYWRAGKPSPEWCPAAALRAQPAGGGEVVALMDKFRALVAAHDGEFAFVDGVKLCLRELEAAIAGCQPVARELPKYFVEYSESEKSAYMRGITVGENIASRDHVFAALDSVVPGWRERGSDTASAAATAITELSARATSNGAKPFRWDDDEGEAPSAWGPK